MIKNITRKYFEVWGTEAAQNAILKGFVGYLCAILFIETIALAYLSNRGPTLIGVSSTETKILAITPPKAELLKSELQRVLMNYVQTHYSWDANTIESAHREASKYVAADFQAAYFKANLEQVKFVKEKKVRQKVYPVSLPQVDLKSMTARIQLDRIFSIEGMNGSAPITLDVHFDYGPRTELNPEGIYITDEKLVNEEGGK